jgi:RND family efflux transporter MFP subunit
VRLVANIVEKDLDQVQAGDDTRVEVDAFPGEVFTGRIARVAPVLDPATRTASIEVEIPNPGFRLKPGMYARVTVTTDERKDALLVPSNAVVDLGGQRGVFLAAENATVSFRPVTVGIEEDTQVEILDGLTEGDRVVTTGAGALRNGDRVLLAASGAGRRGAGAPPAAANEVIDGPSEPREGGRRGVGGQLGGQRGQRAAGAAQP